MQVLVSCVQLVPLQENLQLPGQGPGVVLVVVVVVGGAVVVVV